MDFVREPPFKAYSGLFSPRVSSAELFVMQSSNFQKARVLEEPCVFLERERERDAKIQLPATHGSPNEACSDLAWTRRHLDWITAARPSRRHVCFKSEPHLAVQRSKCQEARQCRADFQANFTTANESSRGARTNTRAAGLHYTQFSWAGISQSKVQEGKGKQCRKPKIKAPCARPSSWGCA